MGVASACGDAEICAVRSLVFLVPLGLRAFFAVIGRRAVWRLPVFFIAGAPESAGDRFASSTVLVFLGTGGSVLNDFNSFIVPRLVRKCFLALFTR